MDLKFLLKRGALLAAANWPVIAIQLAAETTLYAMLTVPLIGAAILVALAVGGDVGSVVSGNFTDTFTTIAEALRAEPITLVAFVASFLIVLIGGSTLIFLVKGGVVEVLLVSQAAAGPIEEEPFDWERIRATSRFTTRRFVEGCLRFFPRYLTLGILLMVAYGLSGGACLAFLVYGVRAAGSGFVAGWAVVAALAALALEAWITAVNVIYLLLQIAVAAADASILEAFAIVGRLIRARARDLGGVFLVVLVMIVGATIASALAWSGVGLIAFIPLIGIAVFPLQVFALVLRGVVFDYIGLTALGAYITVYHRHAASSRIIVPGAASVSHPAS